MICLLEYKCNKTYDEFMKKTNTVRYNFCQESIQYFVLIYFLKKKKCIMKQDLVLVFECNCFAIVQKQKDAKKYEG